MEKEEWDKKREEKNATAHARTRIPQFLTSSPPPPRLPASNFLGKMVLDTVKDSNIRTVRGVKTIWIKFIPFYGLFNFVS